jgi:hypothetical protein
MRESSGHGIHIHRARAGGRRMSTGPRTPVSDDPGGGRRLTRRLRRVLPIAFAAGLVPGVVTAVAVGDWRPAVAVPLGIAALAGTIAAAVEDGRVNRDVQTRRDESARDRTEPPA